MGRPIAVDLVQQMNGQVSGHNRNPGLEVRIALPSSLESGGSL